MTLRGRAARRLLATACTLAWAGLLALPASALASTAAGQQAAGTSGCLARQAQLVQVTAAGQAGPQDLAGSVPVIFVHGINSSADMWKASAAGSLAWQTATAKGFTAWTFDYRQVSLDWVTNGAIGPALATAIGCLAQASGHQVIIVAHSMGGLAAQYAIGEPGSPAAAKVAEVITVGTPYTGSQVLTTAQAVVNGTAAAGAESGDAAEAVFAEALLSACAGAATHTDSNPCSIVSALKSPVGTALEVDSAAIAELPPWPAALPVLDVAGNMDVTFGVGSFSLHAHPGDLAVTLPSATGHETAPGPFVLPCRTSFLSLTVLRLPSCYHGNLVNQPGVIAEILGAIKKFQPAGGPAASGTALPASAWTSVGGATLTAQPGGVLDVQYDPTYWGGAIAHTDAGCNYTFSGQGRVLSGGGYGLTAWASVDQDGTPHGQAIQYDMGEDGYRDAALPENSETGSVHPAAVDGNWHTVSIQVSDGRYTSSVDGKVIFTGAMTVPCTSDVFIRLWNSTDAEFRDMTVTPLG